MRHETKQLIEKADAFETKMKEMNIKITGRKTTANNDIKKADFGDVIKFEFTVTIE